MLAQPTLLYGVLDLVWFDQNWNRFHNPACLFRPYFSKPNMDSWYHKPTPWLDWWQTSIDNCPWELQTVCFINLQPLLDHELLYEINIKEFDVYFDKIRLIKLINSCILMKARFRFCPCLHATRLGFLCAYHRMVSRSVFKIQTCFWPNQTEPKTFEAWTK